MTLLNTTSIGDIHISEEAIEKAAGMAAMECYGIVGMASQKKLKDGVFELLGKENAAKGIIVRVSPENEVEIDINVVIKYGVKISEVASSIQTKVSYDLTQMLGLNVAKVNIYVQGVQVEKDDK